MRLKKRRKRVLLNRRKKVETCTTSIIAVVQKIKIPRKKAAKLGFKKRDNYTRCKNSAIYSLAMREHSRKEIRNKLALKTYIEGVDVDKLLNELED